MIRVPIPAGVNKNSPSILVRRTLNGPLKSVMLYRHECGSSTQTTVSRMLPPPASSSTRVCPQIRPVICVTSADAADGGDRSVPAPEHGGYVHLDDASERLLRRHRDGPGLFNPRRLRHRAMLAFLGDCADVVQWQNISFPS